MFEMTVCIHLDKMMHSSGDFVFKTGKTEKIMDFVTMKYVGKGRLVNMKGGRAVCACGVKERNHSCKVWRTHTACVAGGGWREDLWVRFKFEKEYRVLLNLGPDRTGFFQ